MNTMDRQAQSQFQELIWTFYRDAGRALPWRKTTDPYAILVSEVMLQQTQVPRVIEKYRTFLERFPTPRELSEASLRDVLALWQGLGYNRRARLLQQAAQHVHVHCNDRFPDTYEELVRLPGVGDYTARAVRVFAFNQPETLIETNVRTVYIYHFRYRHLRVDEADIRSLVADTLDADHPREWYSALMDYGAHLKQTVGNLNRRSTKYTTQSRFEGSNRQLRGIILRELTSHGRGMTARTLARRAERSEEDAREQLEALVTEGMLERRGNSYRIR